MIETMPDPTLESLVPQRSTARNVALVAAGALVLLGLWFAPLVVTPDVVPADTGGGNAPVRGGVLATAELEPRSVGPVTLVEVAPAPGARVVNAWVVRDPGATTGHLDDATIADDAGAVAPGSRYDPLPAQVDDGEHATLLIHWAVDDCADLAEGYRPTLVASAFLGLRYDVELHEIAGGESDAFVVDLAECVEAHPVQ